MKRCLVLASLMFAGLAAQGQSFLDKRDLERQVANANARGDSTVGAMNGACGYAVPITFDARLAQAFKPTNESAAAYCSYTRRAMERMCLDYAPSKAAIRERVKAVSCTLGEGRDGLALAFDGGTLTMAFGPQTNKNSLTARIVDFLEEQLTVAGPAGRPEPLGQRKELERQSLAINAPSHGTVSGMNRQCGYSAPISFDYGLLATFEPLNESASTYCAYSRTVIEKMCRDNELDKGRLKERVARIHCLLSERPESPRVSLRDGTLEVAFGVRSYNRFDDQLRALLLKGLR